MPSFMIVDGNIREKRSPDIYDRVRPAAVGESSDERACFAGRFDLACFESVDAVQIEFALPNQLDTLHHLDQPTSSLDRLIAEEERLSPLLQDDIFGLRPSIADDEDLSRVGNLIEQYVAADPARTPCRLCERLTLLDYLANEKMLWNDEQVRDGECLRS